jgi:hypothetical protein
MSKFNGFTWRSLGIEICSRNQRLLQIVGVISTLRFHFTFLAIIRPMCPSASLDSVCQRCSAAADALDQVSKKKLGVQPCDCINAHGQESAASKASTRHGQTITTSHHLMTVLEVDKLSKKVF